MVLIYSTVQENLVIIQQASQDSINICLTFNQSPNTNIFLQGDQPKQHFSLGAQAITTALHSIFMTPQDDFVNQNMHKNVSSCIGNQLTTPFLFYY